MISMLFTNYKYVFQQENVFTNLLSTAKSIKGETLNYKNSPKWLLWMTSYCHILSSLNWYPGVNFWPCFFYLQLPSFLVVMTIKLWLKTKTPKTQAAYILFRWNKNQRIECISDAKTDIRICWNLCYWKSYDVKNTFWCLCFLVNANLDKSLCQFLHLNALYPLAFVPLKKDVSCLSFRSFCFQVTWLTKYGHDYQKWWQLQIEGTWQKLIPG